MAFTLYNAPQSTCSQRVRFVLTAKQPAVRRGERSTCSPATSSCRTTSRSIPTAVVPTLDHDGSNRDQRRPSSPNISTKSYRRTESLTPRDRRSKRAPHARADALHRRDAGRGGAGADLQPRLSCRPLPADEPRRSSWPCAESKPLRKEFMMAMGQHGISRQKEMDAAQWRGCAAATSACDAVDRRTAAGRGCWAGTSPSPTYAVMPALVRMRGPRSRAHLWSGPAARRHLARQLDPGAARRSRRRTITGSLLSERFPHLREKAMA